MGNKKKKSGNESSLGRALIKDRAGSNRGKRMVSDSTMLHTTEIQDGYDWGRLNLQSVTEESSFQQFLSTAQLADTEFQAEKLNIKFVNPRSNVGLLSAEEMSKLKDKHEKYKEELKIPRRPPWNANTTASELDRNEKLHFLEWRRSLAELQETKGISLTPYEKNLQFWRQLWRVVERSDVVVQIVDARNPLLFRCEDLEKYVKEVSKDKMNLVLLNKADFLTENQRECWAKYFTSLGVRIVFFSAYLASLEDENKKEWHNTESITSEPNRVVEESKDTVVEESKQEPDDSQEEETLKEFEDKVDLEAMKSSISDLEAAVDENADYLGRILSRIGEIMGKSDPSEDEGYVENSSNILTRYELIELFRTFHTGPKVTNQITTIGLVGYPNVGKSSTINALLSCKKVSVSATPGKTKHFQTLYLEKDILLCDCPGLVMPSFVFTKAEMILNGILPIDQMRDHVPPTNLVTSLIPRHVIENKYGIMIPPPMEGEDPDRPPTAEELLNAYAYNRGFMTSNGQPDNSRAARYVLKDYMNGKLLFCHAPPGMDQAEYYKWPPKPKVHSDNKVVPPQAARALKPYRVTTQDLDKAFFNSVSEGVHTKGKTAETLKTVSFSQEGQVEEGVNAKPWKQYNKHKNKGKKEKLRRVFSHLDEH